MKFGAVAALFLFLWVTSCLTFDLTILHTNDCHARIEQAGGSGGSCGDSDALAGKCYGGVARRLTKIREIREAESDVVLLDAGDQFQGTLWFYFYSGLVTAQFMNKMQYDVMAFGNHEFDNKVEGLIPFLRAINFTMVSCNIDATQQPEMQALFQPSVVLEVGGERVGVIGYTTPNTTFLVSAGLNLVFSDEVAAITAEIQNLQAQGVNKIIALGHSGIDADITIAKHVPGLDVVIGGHTNTFLYTGTPPEDDPKYGEYPLTIQSEVERGRQVLVVQDYSFGKYLGYLRLTFDDSGEVTSFGGNPILLDGSVPRDNETLTEVLSLKEEMASLTNQEAGRTHVFLEGRREVCRQQECNLGNLITDAMVRQNLKNPDEAKWADVATAVWNAGGIRAPIPFRPPDGIISTADVLTVVPFQNSIDIVVISGDILFQMFEHSVSSMPARSGQFLQVSGILVTYDISKPVGQRVVSLEARCSECAIPQYEPVERGRRYKLLMNAFMADGGDGYSMLSENSDREQIGYLDSEMILDYLKDSSPITTGLERRITISNDTAACSQMISAGTACDNIGGSCLDWRYNKCTAGYETGLCSGDSNMRCCKNCGSSCISDEDYWSTYSDGACDSAGGECKDDSNYCNGHYNTGMCGGPAERKCCLPHGASGDSSCTVRPYSNSNFVGDRIHVEDGFRGSMDRINSAAGRCGVKVWITHSWRKLGAFLGGAIVQPASNSNHLVGHAIDMNIQRLDGSLCDGDCLQGQWDSAANCFLDEVVAAGLTWGGMFDDPVHIDDRYNTNPNAYYALRNTVQAACGHVPMT